MARAYVLRIRYAEYNMGKLAKVRGGGMHTLWCHFVQQRGVPQEIVPSEASSTMRTSKAPISLRALKQAIIHR